MSGQQPTQEQIKKWQTITETTQGIPQIEKLSEAEVNVNNLLQSLNEVVTSPLNDLYQ
jgi:cell fate (sporulation/competence/biofilm development) regulator YlbF (YheA/YmcA/DUF963 family)